MFSELFLIGICLFHVGITNVSVEGFSTLSKLSSHYDSIRRHHHRYDCQQYQRYRCRQDVVTWMMDDGSKNNNKNNNVGKEEEMEELVEFAKELADVAGNAIRPYWRLTDGVLQTEQKMEEGRSLAQTISPVTIADRAAERAMRDLIEATYPSHGILGEEYGSMALDAEYVWVLDPIDGTKAFITGKPTFGTLIGLLYQGTPILGIIDQPISKERWLGAPHRPSTFNDQPISVFYNNNGDDDDAAISTLEEATVYTTTPDMFRAGEEMEKFELVRDTSLRTLYGCDCYAYALLASGWGVQVVMEADLGLYDYCALVPIIQGAGGIITDWTGHTLTLSHHDASQGRVLATSHPQLHRQIIHLLSSYHKPKQKTSKTTMTRNYLITLLLGIIIGTKFPLRFLS